MIKNKRAQDLAVNKIIVLILVVFVIAFVIWALFHFGVISWFKNLPAFGGDSKITTNPNSNTNIVATPQYTFVEPDYRVTFKLLYNAKDPSKSDIFWFWWDNNDKNIKMRMSLNNNGLDYLKDMDIRFFNTWPGNWYTDPNEYAFFPFIDYVTTDEKKNVEYLSQAKSQEDLFERLAKIIVLSPDTGKVMEYQLSITIWRDDKARERYEIQLDNLAAQELKNQWSIVNNLQKFIACKDETTKPCY